MESNLYAVLTIPDKHNRVSGHTRRGFLFSEQNRRSQGSEGAFRVYRRPVNARHQGHLKEPA
jgi:hypothetical protein